MDGTIVAGARARRTGLPKRAQASSKLGRLAGDTGARLLHAKRHRRTAAVQSAARRSRPGYSQRMDHAQFVCDMWRAWSSGDFGAIEASFAPDARWRAVEDGPWNCESGSRIVNVIRQNRERRGAPEGEGSLTLANGLWSCSVPRTRPPMAGRSTTAFATSSRPSRTGLSPR